MPHCVITDENIAGFKRAIGLSVSAFRIPLGDVSVFESLMQRGELTILDGAGTYLLVSDKEHQIEVASALDVPMVLETLVTEDTSWEYVLVLSPEIGGDLSKRLMNSQHLKTLLFDSLENSVLMYEVKSVPDMYPTEGNEPISNTVHVICNETIQILPLLGFPEITPPETVPEELFPEFQHNPNWPSGWKNWKIPDVVKHFPYSPTAIAPVVFEELVAQNLISKRTLDFLLSAASGKYFFLTSGLPALRRVEDGQRDTKGKKRYWDPEYEILGVRCFLSREWWGRCYPPLMQFVQQLAGWTPDKVKDYCVIHNAKVIELKKEL